ncbi:MAG: glycosyltransferase [Flavobacteriales bacterium]
MIYQKKSTFQSTPEILFITSFPPRECGIATYSQDLINALRNKFEDSFNLKICALESEAEIHSYPEPPAYILNTSHRNCFAKLAFQINKNERIQLVVIQHEFGFFVSAEDEFNAFIQALNKEIVFVFHTVLPHPDEKLKHKVRNMAKAANQIIVMTRNACSILVNDYNIDENKISAIAHGTHLVPLSSKEMLKTKYHLEGKKVLSTFGLLSAGKSIETTLEALPSVIVKHPDVLFLIIGKTHPTVLKQEGEKYRSMLEEKVIKLKIQNNVRFINSYLPLEQLLQYLQLTDLYLFTSKDRNQAVSGTFSYAVSCGCPVISTPIPHALEVLKDDGGIIIDFEDSKQLSREINRMLNDLALQKRISLNGLHRMAPTAWENSAIAHARLFENASPHAIQLKYKIPEIKLNHILEMTTAFGMIQFAKISQPDIDSGFTLDDNARALVAVCQHFELTHDLKDLQLIEIYFNFIQYCQSESGKFLNYIDEEKEFTRQNAFTNLEDSNGRAIWALGYLISLEPILPAHFISEATTMLEKAALHFWRIHSPRAMAFAIKGLYYQNAEVHTPLLTALSDRLVQMYRHESDTEWQWFESYLTYGNSILPEALLCAGIRTGNSSYTHIAQSAFDFLLSKIFQSDHITVVSNKGWLHRGYEKAEFLRGGEQPIDVAYTILALEKFHSVFRKKEYQRKMITAFNWFLGKNHLQQIMYNPCTGGCYDGLEDTYINLNQGAESTVSYLMARLTVQKSLMRIEEENEDSIGDGLRKERAVLEEVYMS